MYVSINHPASSIYEKQKEKIIGDFTYYLKESIGVVAVMRLAIDPYPILLMDENLLLREFDSITEGYSEKFIHKYITEKYIYEYKQTDIYSVHENFILSKLKKSFPTFNVMKHNVIDLDSIQIVLKELHLLDNYDSTAVLLANASEKVIKVYAIGGLQMYFTNRDTNRKSMSWSSKDFIGFLNNAEKINQKYDEVFISVYIFNETDYYIEHNEKITEKEYKAIEEQLTDYFKKLY